MVIEAPAICYFAHYQARDERFRSATNYSVSLPVLRLEIIGIGYVTFAADNKISAMFAGVAARNRLAAAGAMMNVAMATAYEACDDGEWHRPNVRN